MICHHSVYLCIQRYTRYVTRYTYVYFDKISVWSLIKIPVEFLTIYKDCNNLLSVLFWRRKCRLEICRWFGQFLPQRREDILGPFFHVLLSPTLSLIYVSVNLCNQAIRELTENFRQFVKCRFQSVNLFFYACKTLKPGLFWYAVDTNLFLLESKKYMLIFFFWWRLWPPITQYLPCQKCLSELKKSRFWPVKRLLLNISLILTCFD